IALDVLRLFPGLVSVQETALPLGDPVAIVNQRLRNNPVAHYGRRVHPVDTRRIRGVAELDDEQVPKPIAPYDGGHECPHQLAAAVEKRGQAAEGLVRRPHEDRESPAAIEFSGAVNAIDVALAIETRPEKVVPRQDFGGMIDQPKVRARLAQRLAAVRGDLSLGRSELIDRGEDVGAERQPTAGDDLVIRHRGQPPTQRWPGLLQILGYPLQIVRGSDEEDHASDLPSPDGYGRRTGQQQK